MPERFSYPLTPLPFFTPSSSVGQCREPRFNRVPFDVALHSRGPFVVRDQVIVTFVLPKSCSTQAEHPNGFVTGEALKRPEPFSGGYARSHQQMNVIRHDHERVQLIPFESSFAVGKGAHNQLCYFRLAEKDRAACRMIEQSVHCRERLSLRQPGVRKGAIDRKTSVQSEGHEHSLANDIPMRKAPIVSVDPT
jgi:hypothetical protein